MPSTIQIIFLLYSALSFSAGVLIAALFWNRNDLSAKLWIFGCWLTAIATAVTVFRSDIPVFFSYSLMVSFEVLSIFIFSESLKQLSSDPIRRKFSWLTLMVPLMLFLIVEIARHLSGGIITPTISAISSFAFGLANLLCLYHARLIGKDFSNRFFFQFLAIIFGFASLLYFLRVVNIYTGYSGFVFDPKIYNLIIWFVLSLLNSIRNLTYIVLRLHLGFSEHSRLNNMNLKLSNTLEERNEMILSIQRLNKSASINALASTISHEINQPLGASKLNAQFIEMKLESDPTNLTLLKELNKSVLGDINRASVIVKNLSRLTSSQSSAISPICLSESIHEIAVISAGKLRASQIDIKIDCDSRYRICVNSSEWQQVLVNVFNNAIDALDNTPRVNKRIIISASKSGELIRLCIQDNGHGILQGMESQIFEMAVSNKEAGSGIGLWLSKNIINRFSGSITAHNSIDGGACFVIELPSA